MAADSPSHPTPADLFLSARHAASLLRSNADRMRRKAMDAPTAAAKSAATRALGGFVQDLEMLSACTSRFLRQQDASSLLSVLKDLADSLPGLEAVEQGPAGYKQLSAAVRATRIEETEAEVAKIHSSLPASALTQSADAAALEAAVRCLRGREESLSFHVSLSRVRVRVRVREHCRHGSAS
jgi:hypothetical protein